MPLIRHSCPRLDQLGPVSWPELVTRGQMGIRTGQVCITVVSFSDHKPELHIGNISFSISFCPFCGADLHEEAETASKPTSTG